MCVLVKNGTVASVDGQAKQDSLIENGVVRQLGNNIPPQLPYEEIDTAGCYVFPGGVDIHTHSNIDADITCSCGDFFTGIRAAACGGTTTVIDHMGFGPNGCRLYHQLEVYHGYAIHKAVIDYGLHGAIQHINHAIPDEIPIIVEEELSSFKLYLAYQYKLNDDEVLQALRRLYESGASIAVHPENDAAIANKRAELIAAGLAASRYHILSRPPEYGAEAIARMINLAQIADNASLYIVHLLSGLGLNYLRLAHANHRPVWVETCPRYLLLNGRSYDTEDGVKFILSPSLRNIREQDKLWRGISDGVIGVVAADHCTSSMVQRLQIPKGDFSCYPSSLPGVENRIQLLFSSGVTMGHITPEHFVEPASAMPARLLGLWSQKELLASGSDGDVVIVDPRQSQQVWHRHLHDNADYPPREGFIYQGAIVRTLSRGETIFCDGIFIGKAGRSRFL